MSERQSSSESRGGRARSALVILAGFALAGSSGCGDDMGPEVPHDASRQDAQRPDGLGGSGGRGGGVPDGPGGSGGGGTGVDGAGTGGGGAAGGAGGGGGSGEKPDKGTDRDDGGVDAAPGTTVRFAVVGDYGVNEPREGDVASMIKGWKVDFVITTGDNNYSDGEAKTIDANIGKYYASFIGAYKGMYGPGSSANRFWPSLGNHDLHAAGATPYLDYFSLPGNERYYDVDLGLVHLYAVDSDSAEPDGNSASSVQGAWLKARLEASKSCFDIVYFHHPPYSSGTHGPSTGMRWPFKDWGADAVMSGHDHTYERLEAAGLPYFVNGAGGASLYAFGTILPESRFRYNADWGAMLVTAARAGMTFEFWNRGGTKIDASTLAKTCP